MRDEAAGTGKRLAVVLAVAGVALVGCPGEKPLKKRGKRPARTERPRPAAPARTARIMKAFSTPDARAYVRLKPQALFGSKAFKQVFEELTKLRLFQLEGTLGDILKRDFGFDTGRIERLEVAISQEDKLAVAAALFKSSYDKAAVIEKIGAASEGRLVKFGTQGGVDLYRLRNDEAMAFAFVSPTVLVLGEPDAIKSGIDNLKAGRDARVPPEVKELMVAAPAGASLVAAVPSLTLSQTAGLEKLGASSAAVFLGKEGLSRFKSIALAVTSADAFDVWFCLRTVDADAAEEIRKDARASVVELREQSKTKPPEALSILETAPIKEMIDSVKIGGTGSGVEITARVKPDIVKSVGALVGMLGARMGAPGGDFDFDFKADFDD